MQKEPSLPTFNAGDQLHNSQKQCFPYMNLNFKAKNPLTGEKFPGKNPLSLKFNPTQCHCYDYLLLCNKASPK